MIERLKAGLVIAAAAALLIPFIPQPADAQEPGGRFRVIVPDVVPADGSDTHFGNRVSGYLRDFINFPTHIAMSRTELHERAQQFGLGYSDLGCTEARQLAGQVGGQLVMCGEYEEVNGEYRVDVVFYTVPGGEELPVPSFTMGRDQWVAAAEHLSEEFQNLIQQTNQMAYCSDSYRSSNWSDARRYCGQALEYVPDSREVRFTYARTLAELGEWEEALGHFEVLLEGMPQNEEYLENAGYAAAQAGDTERAREYYTRYLAQRPDNVTVRIQIAYDLAQSGDSYGAMQLLEEGLRQEPDNADLHDRYGTYAFRAAIELQSEQGGATQQDGDAPRLSPEVEELFRTALNSLEYVLEEMRDEARASHVTNSMRAYRQLGEPEEAIRIGTLGVSIFPQDAQIRSQLANAYNEIGDVDAAITALNEAIELDPELPQARLRQGTFLLEAGRADEAVTALHRAVEAGETGADTPAQLVFQHAYRDHVQQGNHEEGIRLIQEAKGFDVSSNIREQLNFFHGWALYERGQAVQQPQTLASAQAALPIFRQAREQLQAGQPYAQRSGQNFGQLMEAVATFIEIQEAIIAREGRRR
jgi:tetratricopeptide (TPR) repeat protein